VKIIQNILIVPEEYYTILLPDSDTLKKQFWKENTFWSDGYFVCSTGNANMETIKKYIEEQG